MWILGLEGLMKTTDTSFLPIQHSSLMPRIGDCQLCSVINLSFLKVKKFDDAYVLFYFFSILFK